MSEPGVPKAAKLVIGSFSKDKEIFGEVASRLTQTFGSPDMVSRWLPFRHTRYYEAEMGFPLFRRLMTFYALVEQGSLSDTKHFTNELERKFSKAGKRLVNIDPGHLLGERFVLATGKNFTHRIYVGAGIYGDLTLVYHKGGFQALAWTYPDYREEVVLDFLESVREKYLFQLRQ
jgi:hypothetical protein